MRAKVVVQDGLDHIEEAVLPCMTYKALCRSYVARSAVAHEVAQKKRAGRVVEVVKGRDGRSVTPPLSFS